MAKTVAQLNREIAEVLDRAGRRRRPDASTSVPVRSAGDHVDAITRAMYQTRDLDELVAAVSAAQKHVGAMKRVARKSPRHPGASGYVDPRGEYDPKMYELANLLVDATKHIKSIRTQQRGR